MNAVEIVLNHMGDYTYHAAAGVDKPGLYYAAFAEVLKDGKSYCKSFGTRYFKTLKERDAYIKNRVRLVKSKVSQ